MISHHNYIILCNHTKSKLVGNVTKIAITVFNYMLCTHVKSVISNNIKSITQGSNEFSGGQMPLLPT